MCLFTRVNLSMWGGLVRSWRPTPQSTSLRDILPIYQASSETTAYWVRNASYSFSTEPRSDKSSSKKRKAISKAAFSVVESKTCLNLFTVFLSGVCRPRVPLWGSSPHWGNSFRLRLSPASLQPTPLIGQQWFLQREAHHKTGMALL